MWEPEWRHWTVNERPVAVDSPGQKRRVFVIRRHDDAIALETAKILGQRERYSRAASRIGRVGDPVLLNSGTNVMRGSRCPRVPRDILRDWASASARINLPSIDTVLRAGSAKMGQTAAIFYPAKQEG